MNWRDSPRVREHLAAAYALGTLSGRARRRFEAVLKTDPACARAVADWNRRFEPLAGRLPGMPASEDLWRRIEQRSFGSAAVELGHATPATQPSRWMRWLAALLAPAPAAALVAGVVLGGVVLPQALPLLAGRSSEAELPESYVGVLATAQGRTGMIVSSRRHGRIVDLKRVATVPVPDGQTLYLWTIDATGASRPVAPVPQGAFVKLELPREAEAVFAQAVELGISFEAAGSTPTMPSLPYAYRGLCGKLWRVPPPPR